MADVSIRRMEEYEIRRIRPSSIPDRLDKSWVSVGHESNYMASRRLVSTSLQLNLTPISLKPLPFRTGAFDYVHMRFIGLGVPEHAWPQLLEEACRVLKSGGKLEIVDMSYQLPLSARSLQHSFASLLLSDYIPDDPSRAIKFALPMIDTLLPTSIHPRMQRQLEAPPRALQDAVLGWMSSALAYKSSARESCRTAAHAIAILGWGEQSVEPIAQPLTVYAWVALRI